MAKELLKGRELDRQYSPSIWSKRFPPEVIVDHHIKCLGEATAHAQKVLKCELGVRYGDESSQTLDVYYPGETSEDPSAVLIYLHGGYWSALGVEHSGFLAETCATEGIAVVAIGYDLAPSVNMTTIVQQCRKGCAFIAKKFPRSKLFVGGHSAGGHLSVCMLYTDWSQYGLKTQPFSGSILLSGVYDLDPIQRSCVNEPLQLTEEEVAQFSPQRNLDLIGQKLPCDFPCLMAIGEHESDEFHRQGQQFHQGLLSVGVASSNSTLPGKDHFDILEGLSDISYSLSRSVVDFITAHIIK